MNARGAFPQFEREAGSGFLLLSLSFISFERHGHVYLLFRPGKRAAFSLRRCARGRSSLWAVVVGSPSGVFSLPQPCLAKRMVAYCVHCLASSLPTARTRHGEAVGFFHHLESKAKEKSLRVLYTTFYRTPPVR